MSGVRIPHPEDFDLSPESFAEVKSQYRLPPSSEWARLAFGCENVCYLIACSERHFVLRLTHQRTLTELEAEAQFVSHVITAGFRRVPRFVAARDGAFASVLPAGNALLYEYIDGAIISPLDDWHFDVLLTYLPAFVLATTTTPHKKSVDRPAFPSPFEVFVMMKDRWPNVVSLSDDSSIEGVLLADLECPPWIQLIHGDLHCANFVWNEQGELAGIIDFDDCCNAHPLIEFMALVRGICFTGARLDETRLGKLTRCLTQQASIAIYSGTYLARVLQYVCYYFFTAVNKPRLSRKEDVTNWQDFERAQFVAKHAFEIARVFDEGVSASRTL